MIKFESKYLKGKYYSDFAHLLIEIDLNTLGFVLAIVNEKGNLLPTCNRDTSLINITNYCCNWLWLWIEFYVGKEAPENVIKLDNYRK